MKCILNGKLIDEADTNVSIFDLGLLRGWGVFDFAYARREKVFYGKEHLARFENSAKLLDIKLPYALDDILNETEKLIVVNGMDESLVRWVLTGGVIENGSDPTFAILNEKYISPPEELYKKGIAIKTIKLKREIPEAKTLNYQIRYSNLAEMKKQGYFELLYVSGDNVLECTTANVFMVKHSKLFTPNAEILPGITRGIVIKLATESGIEVSQQNISLTEILQADEVFITNTTKKILPVHSINTQKFSCPGEISSVLMEKFKIMEKNALSG